jgi:hypothetical protein
MTTETKETVAKVKREAKPRLTASEKLLAIVKENPGSYVRKNSHQKSAYVFASDDSVLQRFQKKAFEDVESQFVLKEENEEQKFSTFTLK